MELQFALIAGLFLFSAINVTKRRWVAVAWNAILGLALLVSTIAVLMEENGLLGE